MPVRSVFRYGRKPPSLASATRGRAGNDNDKNPSTAQTATLTHPTSSKPPMWKSGTASAVATALATRPPVPDRAVSRP